MKKVQKQTKANYGRRPVYEGSIKVGTQKYWNVRDKFGRFCTEKKSKKR